MYCAEQAGMLPSDPFEVARTIELTNTLEDVRFCLCGALHACVLQGMTMPVHMCTQDTVGLPVLRTGL